MTDIPFKPGQTYRTRDGREALIYCTDAPGAHPIHGRIAGDPFAYSWTSAGRCYSNFPHCDDLVPPTPPRIREKRWCNVTKEGYFIILASEEAARLDARITLIRHLRVAVPCELVEIVEGEP